VKKCKVCNGKGFVFIQTIEQSNTSFMGIPLWRDTGAKETCSKCFGHGVRNKQVAIFKK